MRGISIRQQLVSSATAAVLLLAAAPPAGAATLTVPCTGDGGGAAGLVAQINAANQTTDPDTIALAPGCIYTVSTIDNYWYGPNGLPPIASLIIIEGNGATIERSWVPSVPEFRLFFVGASPDDPDTLGYTSPGAGSLVLRDLVLRGGHAKGGDSMGGGGGAGLGGAIFSQGSLALLRVTVMQNTAEGGSGGSGSTESYGGGGMGEDGRGAPLHTLGGGFGGAVSASHLPGGGAPNGLVAGGGGGFGINDFGGAPSGGGQRDGLGGGAAGGAGSGAGAAAELFSQQQDGGGGGGFGAGGGNSITFGVAMGNGGGGGVGGGGAGAGHRGYAGHGGFGGGGGGIAQEAGGGDGGFGAGGGLGGGLGGYGGGDGTKSNDVGDPGSGGGGAGMGGAIFNMLGDLAVTNSTIYGNEAIAGEGIFPGRGFGGAIFNLNGWVEIESSTLTANTAPSGAGGIYNLGYHGTPSRSARVTVRRSIIAGNFGSPSDISNQMPLFVAIGLGNATTAIIMTPEPNVINVVDNAGYAEGVAPITTPPALEPLADNGGLTPTAAPRPGSPAIDAGGSGCDAFDQRGFGRPVGAACDIGAVEVGARPPANPDTGPDVDPGPGLQETAPEAEPPQHSDVTPPQTKKRGGPARRAAERKVEFRFTSERGATFLCGLDKRELALCESPVTKQVAPGRHTFTVIAVDAAGNFEPTPARWKFTVLP